jgi:beta-galactosidase
LKVVNGVDPAPLVADLNNLAHQQDPTRMTTLAICQGTKCPSLTSTLNQTTDLLGLNMYTGWYQGTLSGVGPQLDSVRAASPGRALGLSEYGAGASNDFHTDQPVPLQDTEEYAVALHEAYLQAVAARPWLWCVFMWNLADHATDIRAEGDAPGRAEGGLLTYDRSVKKDDWYVYQSWWSPTPTVRLQSARWTVRNAAATTITAIANAAQVEAFLNGTSLGVIAADASHLFHWPATLAPGPNTITVTATSTDGTVKSDSATWTLHTTALNSALIDVGSASPTVDSQGRTWSADTGYTGGNPATYTGTVTNSADPAIAATYRVGQSYYDIPLDNGTYHVTLRLLEPSWTRQHKRLFNIGAQGQNQVVLLDLAQLAGLGAEYDLTFTATVANNALALAFQASLDQAVVSAIEVEPAT